LSAVKTAWSLPDASGRQGRLPFGGATFGLFARFLRLGVWADKDERAKSECHLHADRHGFQLIRITANLSVPKGAAAR